MYTLVYTSDAGSVEFSINSGFVIEEFDAFGGLNTEFATSIGSKKHGVKVEDQKVLPKTITITGTILGDAREKKKTLVHVLAPMMKGTLQYNGQYSLVCYPKSSPVVESKNLNPRFSFMLYIPMPYWQNIAESTVGLLSYGSTFQFPWDWGSTFSFSGVSGEIANAINKGDAPCAWTLDVYAMGDVVNPKLTKTKTGEFVQVNITLTEGQRLVVSTAQDEMMVTLVDVDETETDVFSYLDIDSSSFMLDVGDNPLSFEPADSSVSASVSFFENYAGV